MDLERQTTLEILRLRNPPWKSERFTFFFTYTKYRIREEECRSPRGPSARIRIVLSEPKNRSTAFVEYRCFEYVEHTNPSDSFNRRILSKRDLARKKFLERLDRRRSSSLCDVESALRVSSVFPRASVYNGSSRERQRDVVIVHHATLCTWN